MRNSNQDMVTLRGADTLAVIVLYTLVALVCTRIPLVHSLGYESSFVFAIVGSVASGLFAVGRIRRVYGEKSLERPLVIQGTRRAVRTSAGTNLILLLFPLGVLLANAFFVKNCSLIQGILFFLLLPAVSVVFSTAVAFFCVMHYRHPRLVFFLFFFATFAYAVAVGYYTPAIYSYNFFYGYFPGFTYDEALSVTSTLVSFRLITIALAMVFFWTGNLLLVATTPVDSIKTKGSTLFRALVHPSHRGLFIVLILLAVGVYVFRCDLGYEATGGYIQSVLGGEVKTAHFDIYYPRGLISANEAARLADEHEFRYEQLLNAFSLPRFSRIASYIYPSADAKFRLIGAGYTDIAKPWNEQIHITLQSVHSSLQHEMVHVIAGRFGVPVIRASMRMGLTEGLPMALEGSYGARPLDVYAAAMEQMNVAPDIQLLLSPAGFLTNAPAVSYMLAGSFSRFLIDTYGIRSFLRAYGGGDWKTIYGRPLPLLVREWKDYLRSIDLDGTDIAATKAFFSRTSILQKVCPRVVGERNRIAGRALAQRQYAVAESLYAISYQEGGSFESLSGVVTAAFRRGAYDSVTTILARAETSGGPPERFLLLALLRGDAMWGLDSTDEALQYYHELRTVDLTDGYTEASGLRLVALSHRNAAAYRSYFLTDATDSARIHMLDSLLQGSPHDTLLLYLHGRELMRIGDYSGAARDMDSISFEDQDDILEAQRLTSLGLAAYYTGQYQEARKWFWISLNYDDSDVTEASVNDWIDRCEWKLREQ